mmetsp:Transcript_24305/g.50404  ORF Transcript_24305/g.50404 Transcript_24305/m.50404 type:complete len:215 (+) Transcript_24305:611-1255(+)
MGVLYCRCHHRERGSSRACQEPHLCRLRVLDDKLHLSYGCGINLGWWLAGLTFWRGLHGLCRVRRCASYRWHQRTCWHYHSGSAYRALHQPRGVRVPQPAIGCAGYLCSLVRLVRLQPGFHVDHEVRQRRRLGGTGGHEHHAGGGDGRHHRVPAAIRHHTQVRRWCPVQRHPGRPGLHHGRLRQHGERKRCCHRLDWRFCVSGSIHAAAKAPHR